MDKVAVDTAVVTLEDGSTDQWQDIYGNLVCAVGMPVMVFFRLNTLIQKCEINSL